MTAKQLKNSILKEAVQGKLVSQNNEDEPSSELLKRIKAERDKLIKAGKIKPNKNISSIYRKGNSFYEKRGKDEICIDAELPFEIPKSWEWVRLFNISRTITAGGDKPNKFSKFKNKECLIPVLSNGEKNLGLFGYTDIPRITEPSITVSGRGTIGFSCVRNYPYTPIVRLICIIPLDIINLDYLQIVLTVLLEKGVGTSIKQLTIPMLSPKLIPLPPIEEQKRIVNKLNELMPLIEEYEKLETELNELDKKFPERLKKSILKEAFDGKLIKSSNKWKELTFSKCINLIGIKHKIKRKYYLKNGKYPIIDQSYNFISGYSSNKNILINIKKPVIIFGDHTRCFKFIDFDFIAGADGIKILEPKEFFNEKLFYYFCLSLNIPNRGYSRHYKFLTKIKMRIPPIEEQKRIVEKLDKLMELCEELKTK